jgi:hypothetical protein
LSPNEYDSVVAKYNKSTSWNEKGSALAAKIPRRRHIAKTNSAWVVVIFPEASGRVVLVGFPL